MPMDDGASALWRLLDGQGYKRPCTGARSCGAALTGLPSVNSSPAANTEWTTSPFPRSTVPTSASTPSSQDTLLAALYAPLANASSGNIRAVGCSTAGGAGCMLAHRHSVDIAGGGAAAGLAGCLADCTGGDFCKFSAPRANPPSDRKLKRALGSPEISLEYDVRGHAWNGGGQRCEPPRQKLRAPSNYGRATFARRDVIPTKIAELLHYTNFPVECTKAFSTLKPQT
ncbi:hypothetical protein T484DRAFT_1957365 [Baffinella frigidus]|nr:hypothetical protein T484DRAFT_1957365 [Cryptophyta sp. CCMP2293]